jgi:translation initiation factor IF-1
MRMRKHAFFILIGTAVLFSSAGCMKARSMSTSTSDAQPNLAGIQTTITIEPMTISQGDKIRVTLSMSNKTSDDVRFRYSACIEDHIDLLDSKGEVICRRDGAPITECPYLEVQINAGKTVERTEELDFGKYYLVPPGEYALRFKYDMRLIKAEKDPRPWVPWTNSKLKLIVKE